MTWLNAVDDSYRQEFRELFQAHFGRLEERLKAMESRLETRMDLKLQAQKSELLFWMLLFWVGTIGILKL